ncbi:MAG: peptidoglycan-binding domain-containing protein [Candidatus Omnitrophica bacterium]|nr:peptidoglycan-binding domain-containing protein [Candidatus Omnitrophota bacterium]
MAKKVLFLGLAAIFVFSLSGCATMRKNNDLEIQALKDKVSVLETQLREKDDEISGLKGSIVKSNEEVNMSVPKTDGVNEQPDGKQIQTALNNAGYYAGTVDGKLGKKTRKAVREFQKANNLPIDGKVGKKTWLVLKDYLEKKIK